METLIHTHHHRPKPNMRHQQYHHSPQQAPQNHTAAASKAAIREMKARQRDLETFGEDALTVLGPGSSKQHQPQSHQQSHQRRSQQQQQTGVAASQPSTPAKGKGPAAGPSHRKSSSQDSNGHGDESFSSSTGTKKTNGNGKGGKNRAAGNTDSRSKSAPSPTAQHQSAYTQPSTAPATPIKIPTVSSPSSNFGSLPSFPSANPNFASASLANGLAYAGPRFHNSPSPADLPLPKFASKKLGAGAGAFGGSASGHAAGLLSSPPSTGSFG